MSKNLNVALNFTANTSQAKSQIQELSNLLTKVAYGNNLNINSSSIQAASKAAKELAYHLNNAYNKNTGNYDLSKLNASLTKAKTSISALSADLVKAGTTGQQAFVKLAQTISTADQPVLRMNKHLAEMWTTLKNTARWQISSSLLHGLSGSIQSAYGYAQDLNESLTDIRIVTGQSVDQMAKFAEQANKAAKNLGTTTTKYTDAALIYYQQGLSDTDVQKRTDTTIKMANVTGENAEDVSSYMTAIWNNFDDGSKSLEYYADVITKLGAETAASSEEIANGLEKFAAVGETIGLSYEYATAALTTIIDKTRQSEDVVGTALKTIFARIQGLKEGEETEEGYDLNKYSAVLQQYGISIFDANKELKNMDTILDEMGAKWQTLTKADQVYLAQTVAGVRQYTQLISLMDNWGDVQKNIASAANSDGSLQEQADIYAESWEAARNRVKASLEAIYSDLIDDEFFIDVYNNIAEMVDGVDNFIDSIGGMKTVLLGLGTVFLSMVKTKIGPAMQNLATNITVMTGGAQAAYGKINSDTSTAITNIQGNKNFNEIQKQELINAQQLINVKNKLSLVNKNLSDSERTQAEISLEGLQLQQKEVLELIKKQQELNESLDKRKNDDFNFSNRKVSKAVTNEKSAINKLDDNLNIDKDDINYKLEAEYKHNALEALQYDINETAKAWLDYKRAENQATVADSSGAQLFKNTISNLEALQAEAEQSGMEFAEISSAVKVYLSALPEGFIDLRTELQQLDSYNGNSSGAISWLKDLILKLQNAKIPADQLEKALISMGGIKAKNNIDEITKELDELDKTADQTKAAVEGVDASLDGFNPTHIVKTSEALTAFASGLGSFAMAASSIKSLKETLENPEIDGWEKAISLLMTFSMLSTSFMGVASNMKTAWIGLTTSTWAYKVGVDATTRAEFQNSVGRKNLTAETIRQALANKTLTISLTKLLGVMAIYAAAIGALILLIRYIYKETHDARLEFKEATKNLEDAKNAFDNVATSIENVNSALNELDGAYDTLKDLKRGSAEWYQELDKINSTMSDIIDNYGLTEGEHYFRNDELALELTEAGKNEVEQQNKDRYTNARYTVNAAEFAVGYNEVEALKETIASTMRYSGTPEVYDPQKIDLGVVGAPVERSNLSYDDINKIITEINANPTLNLSNQQELIEAGFSKGSANLITSNSDLQTALKDLAVKVEANTQSYAERITNTIAGDDRFSDALANMQVMQGVDIDTYGTGIIEKAGDDIAAMVHSAIESGKYRNQDLSSYEDDYAAEKGYKKSGDKYYETNENGDIDLSKEVKIDDSQLEYWIAQKEAINDYLKTFNKMKATVENSEKVWSAADNIKKGWEDGKKSLDTYKTNYEKYTKAIDKYGKDHKKANDLKETLDNNIKEIEKYTSSIKTDFANLLGTSDDVAEKILTPEFALKNKEIIEGAINGNIDDLEALGEAAALQELVIDNVNINDEKLMTEINDLHSWLSEYDNDINLEIGANINDQEFINKCNEIILAAGMTAEQAQEYFQNMGYDVQLNKSTIPVLAYEYAVEYTNEYGPFGRLIKSTPDIKEIPYWKKVTAPTIKTITPNGKGFGGNVIARNTGGGGLGSGSASTDPGSGSKTTVDKIDKTKKSDIVDRYKEINDSLEDQSKLLDKINDQTDRLYGKDKIDNLKKANAEIEKENKLLKKKQKEAKEYLKEDKKSLQNTLDKARKKAGLKESDFKFDKDGDIKNYESQMTALYKKLNAAETDYNKKYAGKTETEASKAAKKKVEELQDIIDDLRDTIEQYDETKVLIEELDEQVQDNLNEIQDNNFEALTHEIELKVQINENDKKQLDYYFGKLDDDIYKAAEALAILFSTDNNNLINNAQRSLKNNETAILELKRAYDAGEISQADYLDGMQEQHDSLYDNLEALQELDEQMKEYYGETLDKAAEELAKYTDHLDALNGVLEHYKSILELTGKGQDYKAIDTILQGQAKTTKNNYEISKKNYEMLLKEKEEVQARLALMNESDAGYEIELAKLEALTAATDEAYDEMLSDAEEYLSILRDIWENSMDQIKEATEKALTGGVGFDSLIDSMNRLKDYQSEYLTETNKLFETNKLLGDIQKDIDKTSNVAAKQRLNNFAQEVEQLQKKGKLSNLELEIAQAKYKQLQAQIALEEAQNAKSVVRLSRDNEGNYGYVYTADQDAIHEAEDQLAQAENDLYNIRLNATNKYGEKMAQAWQEYMDECDRITREHVGTQEELDAKLLKLQEEFYRDIEAWSELYAIAQGEDTRVIADAWVNQFDVIKNSGDDWKTTLNDYTDQIMDKWIEWQAAAKEITTDIGIDMGNLAGSVKGVYTESDTMAEKAIKTVIPALQAEIDKVDELTVAYGEQRDTILATIAAMEQLAQQTAQDIEDEIGLEPVEEEEPGDKQEPEKPNEPEKPQEPAKPTSKQGNGVLNVGDEVTFVNGEYYHTSNGDAPTGYYHRGDKVKADRYVKGAKKPWHISTLSGGPLGWLTKSQLSGFDTGGYTGAWGPEGKVAMLHEKEIVLNQEDTSNILKVVEIVRAMIDANAANAGIGVLHSPGINTQNQNLEQTVTITAEFPNATNHSEIELAFDSLINRATQYANRK